MEPSMKLNSPQPSTSEPAKVRPDQGTSARLPAARVIQADVELALDAGVDVPGRLSMANGNDAGGFHSVSF